MNTYRFDFRTVAIAAAVLSLPSGLYAASNIPIPTATFPTTAVGTSLMTSPIASSAPQPAILIGDPSKPPFPTTNDSLDNGTDSPLGGVVSILSSSSSEAVLGSGVALSPYTILTAAHVVDFSGGLTPEGTATGDGTIDLNPALSSVFVNNGNTTTVLGIQSVAVAPGWEGFRNAANPNGPQVQDDLAIITLSSPLPAGTPTYPLFRTPFDQSNAQVILMSGYGGAGDAISGVTTQASLTDRHFGWNIAAVYETDQDPHVGTGKAVVFLSDFDPTDANGDPDPTQTGIDGFPSLGNGVEATISPGDSGGPAFVVDDLNGDGLVEANELSVLGIDTFTTGGWPAFNSLFGGQLVSAYTGFIDANTVPEPHSLALIAGGTLLLLRRRARLHPARF